MKCNFGIYKFRKHLALFSKSIGNFFRQKRFPPHNQGLMSDKKVYNGSFKKAFLKKKIPTKHREGEIKLGSYPLQIVKFHTNLRIKIEKGVIPHLENFLRELP